MSLINTGLLHLVVSHSWMNLNILYSGAAFGEKLWLRPQTTPTHIEPTQIRVLPTNSIFPPSHAPILGGGPSPWMRIIGISIQSKMMKSSPIIIESVELPRNRYETTENKEVVLFGVAAHYSIIMGCESESMSCSFHVYAQLLSPVPIPSIVGSVHAGSPTKRVDYWGSGPSDSILVREGILDLSNKGAGLWGSRGKREPGPNQRTSIRSWGIE